MRPSLWWGLGGALLVGLVFGWFLHRPPSPSVPVQVAQAAVSTASQQAAKAETLYVHDTLRFTRFRAQYDTIHSILNIHDTVAVEHFVTVADSTIRTCSTALSSCRVTVQAKDSVITAQQRLITAALADHPSRFSIVANDAKWVLVGAVLGRVAPKVSLFHLTF